MQPSGAVPDALRLGCQVSAGAGLEPWARLCPQWELLLLLLRGTWNMVGQRAK